MDNYHSHLGDLFSVLEKKREELKVIQNKREQRKLDLDAALIRLDERSRGLYEHLKIWRLSQSNVEGIPIYEFGSNLLLCELARVKPNTPQALAKIEHLRPRLLKLFGDDLLELIRDYQRNDLESSSATQGDQEDVES